MCRLCVVGSKRNKRFKTPVLSNSDDQFASVITVASTIPIEKEDNNNNINKEIFIKEDNEIEKINEKEILKEEIKIENLNINDTDNDIIKEIINEIENKLTKNI
jgi:stress response protein YsnF